VLTGRDEVRFALGAYDRHQTLVIDPYLRFSTYVGGSTFDQGTAIAAGPQGNAFFTGNTRSMDFPTLNPEQSFYKGQSAMFVCELSPDGSSLIYSTYFGGSSYDYPYAIAVDSSGSAYVTGLTESADFPVRNPISATLNGPEDAFVTKFSPGGNTLVYSTYLGGSGSDSGAGIAIYGGAAYVTGRTNSSDFPVTAGAYQTASNNSCGFIAEINQSGAALSYSTYIGQNCAASPASIAVDLQGQAYTTGTTYGGLPVTPGAPQPNYGGNGDAFILTLNATGSHLVYATYLGGTGADSGAAITVDSTSNAYVTGTTNSTDLPVTPSASQPTLAGGSDVVVAKLNSTGTAWEYVTYFGGARDDEATGIAVDTFGNASVVGNTISNRLPLGALQPALGGNPTLLFKTGNGGLTWSPADTYLPSNVLSLATDPASPTHMLAGTNDGLYQTTDDATDWQAVSSVSGPVAAVSFTTAGGPIYAGSQQSFSSSLDGGATWTLAGNAPCGVGTIAWDPVNTRIVYISNGSPTVALYPACAAKSTDGGATWTTLSGLTLNYDVSGIAINPKVPSVVYVSTDSGLFKSTNAGATFTALSIAGLTNPYVSLVAINPAQPAVVYTVANFGMYKTTNAGSTWTQLSGAPFGITSLVIAPSKPSTLYAGTSNGVHVSTNGGTTWSPAGLTGEAAEPFTVSLKNPSAAFARVPVSTNGLYGRFNAAGKLGFSSHLGGSGNDSASGVAVLANGDAVITGSTQSPNFPTTASALQPAEGRQRFTAVVATVSGKTPACSYTASPASSLFYSYGGLADFSVVAPSGCAWTPTPSASWITVTSGRGPGISPLAITVAANPGPERSGGITIGSGSILIKQAASGCSYGLSNSNPSFPQAGGQVSIDVTTNAACSWRAAGLPPWLTVSSGGSGTGSGTVVLQAAPNPFPGSRCGSPSVASQFVYACQAGTGQ